MLFSLRGWLDFNVPPDKRLHDKSNQYADTVNWNAQDGVLDVSNFKNKLPGALIKLGLW